MKFISILTIVGAVSATIVQRDLQTIQKVLDDINAQVTTLDNAVKGWSSGDTSSLTSASDQLLSIINAGVGTVSGTSALTETDALNLASYFTGLGTGIQTVVNDFIAKKDALVAAGAGPVVLKSLQDQKAASQKLADTITSKVPQSLQSIAAQLSGQVADNLQKGIDAFQGAGGAAPGSSGSAAPTGAAPTGSGSSPSGSATGIVPSAPCPTSSAASVPVPELPNASTASAISPVIPGISAPALPTLSSGESQPSLTSVPGAPSASGSATGPTPFTGAASKINGLGGASIALVAAILAVFA